MRNSTVGMILGVIILFLGLVVMPTYYISLIQWRNDVNTAQVAARNFVDMVIDSGEVTEGGKAWTDLSLTLASCYSTMTYTVYKEEKVTNPVFEGGVVTSYNTTYSYAPFNENCKFATGDIVTIVIEQTGSNIFQRLARGLLGIHYNNIEVRLSGMVR